jgi:DivIVA domain-containing protein
MDVTPELLRDAEFKEQRRGYDTVEVRDFLARMADAVGRLQDEVSAAQERANRAERRLLDASPEGEELSRTLVLAQRTADAVLDEARQRAAEVQAEAEAKAATVTAEAEARAATTGSAADERAAAVVADAEGRVATELVPLLEQRDALQRDIDALRSWADAARTQLADGLRRQLAWLETDDADLPPAPVVTDVTLPEPVAPQAGGAEAGEVATTVADGAAPPAGAGDVVPGDGETGPDQAAGEVRQDPTAVLDLREVEDGPRHDDGGALATAAADDPFLAELRRAVTENEPLGPRDEVSVDSSGEDVHVDDDPLGPSSVFRRRKRH